MSIGEPARDINEALDAAEEQTQDYVIRRPPPFFVQRRLNLINVPKDKRLALLQSIFPSVDDPNDLEISALGDFAAFTQRDDVACLNRYFYQDLGNDWGIPSGKPELSYAKPRTARIHFWSTVPMRFWAISWWSSATGNLSHSHWLEWVQKATISEAMELLDSAYRVAKDRRDWLRWHRIAANQVRLRYLIRDQSEELSRALDMAIGLGQLCLDHGVPVDRSFHARRDELLHMAGVVKVAQRDITYPNLCAHIKSPGRIKPPPGAVRLSVESGALIANVSVPLLFGMEEAIRQGGEHTAFVDWLSLEDRVQVWMTYKGRYHSRALGYRELHALDNLDLIFRPNQFEVMLSTRDEPLRGREDLDREVAPAEGDARADRVAYVGRDFFQGSQDPLGSDVVEGMKWVLRFPILEGGFDKSGHSFHREYSSDMTGMKWERSLGRVLATVLPDDKDLEHVVVSADGPLALLPFHLTRLPDGRLLTDRYKVSYAPSLKYFSPAPNKDQAGRSRIAVVLNSRNRLQGPIWELQRLRKRLGKESILALDGYEGDRDSLQARLADRDIIHVATHGRTFTDTPQISGIELSHGRMLSISSIETLALKPGCLVFLNACGSNRVTIQSRIQFSSIANSFLAAGASTVIATFWETDDVAAALISDRFYMHLVEEGRGRLESLDLALDWLKALDLDQLPEADLGKLAFFLPLQRKQPYRNPAHWGQLALFGHW